MMESATFAGESRLVSDRFGGVLIQTLAQLSLVPTINEASRQKENSARASHCLPEADEK